jgi:integrase
MVLDMRAQKTGKVFINLPLPDALRPTLRKYLAGRVGPLFGDTNVRKAWDALRIRANLPKVTRQDLRMTNSTFIQRIGSIGSAKTLLQHSSSRTTGEFYTDDEVVMRWKIQQLPVREWLKKPK